MKGFNVLIVEDEAIFAEVLKSFLTNKKLNVLGIFDNVKETLNFLKENEVDFVFIDIYLKGKDDGFFLAKELRKRDIPFMVITAISDKESVDKLKNEGSFGYIVKPIDLYQLDISVDIAISQAHCYRRIKKEKKNLENKLKDVFDSLQLMFIELDTDYNILFMNNLVKEKLKINPLWHKSFLDVFSEEQRKILDKKLELAKSGEIVTLNLPFNNQGNSFSLFVRISPIIEEDGGLINIKGIRILMINIFDIIYEFALPNEDFFKSFSLSSRETEILKCIIKFQSNEEIARTLFISVPTVKFHIKNIYSKLNIKNRKELIEKLKNYYNSYGNECYSLYLLNILLEH